MRSVRLDQILAVNSDMYKSGILILRSTIWAGITTTASTTP